MEESANMKYMNLIKNFIYNNDAEQGIKNW